MPFMNNIDWREVIKKEARGVTDKEDLGEVQKVEETHIITKRGFFKKTYFCISKELVEYYDGHTLRFRITEKEARKGSIKDNRAVQNRVTFLKLQREKIPALLYYPKDNEAEAEKNNTDIKVNDTKIAKWHPDKEARREDIQPKYKAGLSSNHLTTAHLIPLTTLRIIQNPQSNNRTPSFQKKLIPIKHTKNIEDIIDNTRSNTEAQALKDEILKETVISKENNHEEEPEKKQKNDY